MAFHPNVPWLGSLQNVLLFLCSQALAVNLNPGRGQLIVRLDDREGPRGHTTDTDHNSLLTRKLRLPKQTTALVIHRHNVPTFGNCRISDVSTEDVYSVPLEGHGYLNYVRVKPQHKGLCCTNAGSNMMNTYLFVFYPTRFLSIRTMICSGLVNWSSGCLSWGRRLYPS
jgi:hypothetical protein